MLMSNSQIKTVYITVKQVMTACKILIHFINISYLQKKKTLKPTKKVSNNKTNCYYIKK